MGNLRREFGDASGKLPDGFPLFPNADGNWCSKDAFVATIAEMARRLDLPTVDALGRSTVGEHVWRITGARHLASLDVPVPIIKLLARWGSDVIVRYVADAPLSALTRVYVERVQASDEVARGLLASSSASCARAPATIATALVALRGVPVVDEDAADSELRPFVISITGKVHLVSAPPHLGTIDSVRTPCGWRFKESGEHQMVSAVPPGAACCKHCGNDSVWSNVHALVSQLTSGYESDLT
jgi:hypothetical protein